MVSCFQPSIYLNLLLHFLLLLLLQDLILGRSHIEIIDKVRDISNRRLLCLDLLILRTTLILERMASFMARSLLGGRFLTSCPAWSLLLLKLVLTVLLRRLLESFLLFEPRVYQGFFEIGCGVRLVLLSSLLLEVGL